MMVNLTETLIVSQTGCGRNIQNLAKNKTGKLKDIFWLSKIMLSQD